MKTYKFDPVRELENDAMIDAYVDEAYKIGDANFVETALTDAQEARRRHHLDDRRYSKDFVTGVKSFFAGARHAGFDVSFTPIGTSAAA